MSLLFIMGGHVKWVACAVAPLLKKRPLEQAVRGFGRSSHATTFILGRHVKRSARVASAAAHPCI